MRYLVDESVSVLFSDGLYRHENVDAPTAMKFLNEPDSKFIYGLSNISTSEIGKALCPERYMWPNEVQAIYPQPGDSVLIIQLPRGVPSAITFSLFRWESPLGE